MLRTIAALLVGEALLLTGLWFAWWPSAPLAAGAQLVAWALLSEHDRGPDREIAR